MAILRNPTAQEMGRKGAKNRWRGKSKEERLAHTRMMARARWRKGKPPKHGDPDV